MAIAYPLNTPTNIGIANIAFSAENAVAISQSPFTYAQQIVSHPGQRWGATISLPPMKRQDAEYWVAFLLSLKGQAGTFLLGDPNCVAPQGTALPRKNLYRYTEQFDNAVWGKPNILAFGSGSVADAILAPNGLTVADLIVENTTPTVAHGVNQTASFIAGNAYTLSVYAKAQSARNIRIDLAGGAFGSNSALFNPTTGSVISSGGGVTTTVTPLADGWFRFSTSKVCVTTATGNSSFYIIDGTTATYTGDGVSGVYIWGSQLEIASAPTSYQAIIASYGPFVNGGSQTGGTLAIDGASPSQSGYFLPGDYIQLGAGSSATLHKVLTTTDTNSAGEATLDIWPSIRTAPADNAAVSVANAKGRFRLKENNTQWQINDISSYGITFDCVEAI